MFRIGDFSRFSRVSVRALRLYDQVGLLKPIHVDQFTGYRYYSAEQLSRLNEIIAFKDLGFSLEQIIKLVNDKTPPTQIRGMLRLKQAEVQQQIENEQTRLKRIEARLQQLEQADAVSTYTIVLKQLEAYQVAAIRDLLPTSGDVRHLHAELKDELRHQNVEIVGFPQTLWHDAEYVLNNVDVEAILPVSRPFSGSERVKSYMLPEVKQMACVIHQGSYDTLVQAFNALLQWIETNNYKVAGANRKIYLQPKITDVDFTGKLDRSIIEIQFPVCGM
ncbi:MAG: MerR family transcriptional regulator [Verrucomicrobia bacterium]|nr:MerR family transcriptional regulator [Leptolyngbya sp. ES-bin-22]